MIGRMLMDGEGLLFGTRVKIRLEWPDGLPYDMTEAELHMMGEDMFHRAGGITDLMERRT